MEDKRTLLAFLFIGLIFLLLPYYNDWMGLTPEPQPQPQNPTTQEQESQTEVGEGAPVIDEQPKVERMQEPAATGQPRSQLPAPDVESIPDERSSFDAIEIVVRTPLQELIFSTQGGSIISCKLLNYNRVDGNTVELVPSGGRGLGIYLQRSNDRADLSSIEFVASRTNLQLGCEVI